jgi:endogenous inhibitor of DNA gyrase (YacG/DUF329 family)
MSARTCPTCGRPAEPDHRPFCSRRCAEVDLQRWFSDRYVVPAVVDDAEADTLPYAPDED